MTNVNNFLQIIKIFQNENSYLLRGYASDGSIWETNPSLGWVQTSPEIFHEESVLETINRDTILVSKENANLIATAPELYASIENLLNILNIYKLNIFLSTDHKKDKKIEMLTEEIDKIYKILAKARGEKE